MYTLILEALFVGFMTILIGLCVGFLLGKTFKHDDELPGICKNWNKNHIMEISLFLTGFTLHLFCEAVGINRSYCSNSFACSKL